MLNRYLSDTYPGVEITASQISPFVLPEISAIIEMTGHVFF